MDTLESHLSVPTFLQPGSRRALTRQPISNCIGLTSPLAKSDCLPMRGTMGGTFVPYLDARHSEEYSPGVPHESFDPPASRSCSNGSTKIVTPEQPRNEQPSSQPLQPSATFSRRISSPPIKAFATEEYWHFGEFISAHYGNIDTHEPLKAKKRKCQIVQCRYHGSSENLSESAEIAKPIRISVAKPKLITIPKSFTRRATSHVKSDANEFAHEFPNFEQLSSEPSTLSLSSRGEQSYTSCDDSGYATQGSYASTGDITPSPLGDRSADVSRSLLGRRLSFKNQIPRWIQKKSSLRKSESVFGSTKGSCSSPCTPTGSKFPLDSPAIPSRDKKPVKATSWSVGWVIDHLETSIMQNPQSDLTLSSPVIIFVRSTTEKALLHPFQDIFPTASIEKLSSLCAAFIAQIYLSALGTYENTNSNPISTGVVADGISDKARTRLGLHLSKASQLRIKERLLRRRSADIHARLDKIVDSILMDLCGTSDSGLKRALMSLVQLLEGNKSSDSSWP
ncbi:hypothetical protein BDBG_06715 [Blastomyces gilchristii SLH14081]|uniref:Uncharacterized protein n=1 Tax=Blastomyces gilchristii (strain SLH14081) TaxID=559298 RepID=A0A179UUW8_BLAGS|nr:uncharacterized protein BDBG_06715 [Blastomyces gilchristii SLH14081]OAT10948.1 hypothetical protein BDBG_06715 [Blastomyces gilchristii SLH14081]